MQRSPLQCALDCALWRVARSPLSRGHCCRSRPRRRVGRRSAQSPPLPRTRRSHLFRAFRTPITVQPTVKDQELQDQDFERLRARMQSFKTGIKQAHATLEVRHRVAYCSALRDSSIPVAAETLRMMSWVCGVVCVAVGVVRLFGVWVFVFSFFYCALVTPEENTLMSLSVYKWCQSNFGGYNIPTAGICEPQRTQFHRIFHFVS